MPICIKGCEALVAALRANSALNLAIGSFEREFPATDMAKRKGRGARALAPDLAHQVRHILHKVMSEFGFIREFPKGLASLASVSIFGNTSSMRFVGTEYCSLPCTRLNVGGSRTMLVASFAHVNKAMSKHAGRAILTVDELLENMRMLPAPEVGTALGPGSGVQWFTANVTTHAMVYILAGAILLEESAGANYGVRLSHYVNTGLEDLMELATTYGAASAAQPWSAKVNAFLASAQQRSESRVPGVGNTKQLTPPAAKPVPVATAKGAVASSSNSGAGGAAPPKPLVPEGGAAPERSERRDSVPGA